MSKLKLFLLSTVITTGVLLIVIYVGRRQPHKSTIPELTRIAPHVFFTAQLKPQDLPFLRKNPRIETIVDLRPDGEAKDQPSSTEIEAAARDYAFSFHYIPVPHETIPDTAVKALTDVLSREAVPTVLYCRTGRRAVRTFALAEASRVGGQSSDAIIEMVRTAGFSADDLRDDIAKRIINRQTNTNAR